MKYFLTGATGFIGGALARQLRQAGQEVHASIRDSKKANELQSLGVKLFTGDVTDKESMREAMQGVDGVFHVAGWYKIGVSDKTPAEKVTVHGTRNVLELMQVLAIPRGVYTSTLAVNSDTRGKVVDENNVLFNGDVLDRRKQRTEVVVIETKLFAQILGLLDLPALPVIAFSYELEDRELEELDWSWPSGPL